MSDLPTGENRVDAPVSPGERPQIPAFPQPSMLQACRDNKGASLVWLGLSLLPLIAFFLWRPLISAVHFAWYYPALLTAACLFHQSLKNWLNENLLWLLTLVFSIGILVGVPQVRYVWASQIPGTSSSTTWILWWSLFVVFILLAVLIFSVSVYVVPRRIRPLPDGAGWWRRYVLGSVEWMISWPIMLRNRLRRVRTGVLGAVAATLAVILWLPSESAETAMIGGLPVTGVLWHHSCIGMLAVGIWLILAGVFVEDDETSAADLEPDGKHPVLMTLGRLLGWLFVLYAIEETAWLLSALDIFSLRAYALLGIMFLLMLAIVAAGSLDFLDRMLPRWPVRLIGIVIFLLSVLLVRPAANSDVQLIARNSEQVDDSGNTEMPSDDAYHHLEMRIRSVPEGDPLVIVANSGGGSRAAIFTSLVCEHLARRPIGNSKSGRGDQRTWADNIVLMSSVSGGSLATAHFVRRSCMQSKRGQLKYTIRDELVDGVRSEIQRLVKNADKDRGDADWEATSRRAMKIRDALGNSKSQHADLWIVDSAFMDDMCINFMAPILRGALALTLFRGEALESFWEDTFGWQGCNNLTGYTSEGSPDNPWYSPGRQPVVLFNACNVDDGARVSVGFPALPDNAFDRQSAKGTRYPPRGLATRHPDFHVSVSLSYAARFSSNFPWGFNPAVVDLRGTSDQPDVRMLLVDGGVSDNTGIDSVFEFVRGLTQPENERGHRILRLLKSRRIVLLEIDSGAKPTPSNGLAGFLGVVSEPIQALSNAAYNNSEIAKQNYVERLNQILSESETGTDSTGDGASMTNVTGATPDRVFSIPVRCNHFDPLHPDINEVMTAWALSPQQKGSVIARFVLELEVFDKKLSLFDEQGDSLQEILNADQAEAQLTDALDAQTDQSTRVESVLSSVSQDRKPLPDELLLEAYQQVQRQQLDFQQAQQVVSELPRSRAEVSKEAGDRLKTWKQKLDSNSDRLKELLRKRKLKTPAQTDVSGQFNVDIYRSLTSDRKPAPQDIQAQRKTAEQTSLAIRQSLSKLDAKSKTWFDSHDKSSAVK